MPRYTETWDVDVVLLYSVKRPDLENINLKELILKTV